ncbi:hypothetical protein HDU96_011048 [Phlyctochytrium bullatum]|nr:hypothetical protein HDU96_011048 [Phlyctochytrium bullatum]
MDWTGPLKPSPRGVLGVHTHQHPTPSPVLDKSGQTSAAAVAALQTSIMDEIAASRTRRPSRLPLPPASRPTSSQSQGPASKIPCAVRRPPKLLGDTPSLPGPSSALPSISAPQAATSTVPLQKSQRVTASKPHRLQIELQHAAGGAKILQAPKPAPAPNAVKQSSRPSTAPAPSNKATVNSSTSARQPQNSHLALKQKPADFASSIAAPKSTSTLSAARPSGSSRPPARAATSAEAIAATSGARKQSQSGGSGPEVKKVAGMVKNAQPLQPQLVAAAAKSSQAPKPGPVPNVAPQSSRPSLAPPPHVKPNAKISIAAQQRQKSHPATKPLAVERATLVAAPTSTSTQNTNRPSGPSRPPARTVPTAEANAITSGARKQSQSSGLGPVAQKASGDAETPQPPNLQTTVDTSQLTILELCNLVLPYLPAKSDPPSPVHEPAFETHQEDGIGGRWFQRKDSGFEDVTMAGGNEWCQIPTTSTAPLKTRPSTVEHETPNPFTQCGGGALRPMTSGLESGAAGAMQVDESNSATNIPQAPPQTEEIGPKAQTGPGDDLEVLREALAFFDKKLQSSTPNVAQEQQCQWESEAQATPDGAGSEAASASGMGFDPSFLFSIDWPSTTTNAAQVQLQSERSEPEIRTAPVNENTEINATHGPLQSSSGWSEQSPQNQDEEFGDDDWSESDEDICLNYDKWYTEQWLRMPLPAPSMTVTAERIYHMLEELNTKRAGIVNRINYIDEITEGFWPYPPEAYDIIPEDPSESRRQYRRKLWDERYAAAAKADKLEYEFKSLRIQYKRLNGEVRKTLKGYWKREWDVPLCKPWGLENVVREYEKATHKFGFCKGKGTVTRGNGTVLESPQSTKSELGDEVMEIKANLTSKLVPALDVDLKKNSEKRGSVQMVRIAKPKLTSKVMADDAAIGSTSMQPGPVANTVSNLAVLWAGVRAREKDDVMSGLRGNALASKVQQTAGQTAANEGTALEGALPNNCEPVAKVVPAPGMPLEINAVEHVSMQEVIDRAADATGFTGTTRTAEPILEALLERERLREEHLRMLRESDDLAQSSSSSSDVKQEDRAADAGEMGRRDKGREARRTAADLSIDLSVFLGKRTRGQEDDGDLELAPVTKRQRQAYAELASSGDANRDDRVVGKRSRSQDHDGDLDDAPVTKRQRQCQDE